MNLSAPEARGSDGKDSLENEHPFKPPAATSPLWIPDRVQYHWLRRKGMFLFSTSIQTGKNRVFPGHPRTTTTERGWDPPRTAALLRVVSAFRGLNVRQEDTPDNRPAARGPPGGDPELRRTRLHPGRNTLAANVPNGKALRSFPGRYVGALAPGGERSGEMESTAHTLT